jgi:LuxR family maltose regulon positive regulatory protein
VSFVRARMNVPRLPAVLLPLARTGKYLDQWAAITVVRGIQGYGKTTLVAGWLRAQPDDAVIPVWIDGRSGDFDQAALATVSRAAEALPPHQRLVLVVDDAHCVRDKALLDEFIAVVAGHEQVHLVLCSRSRHPIETRAAGRVDLVTVPAAELLLTVDEIGELARGLGVDVSRAQARNLHDQFGGWVAPVRIALQAAGDGPWLDGDRSLPSAPAEEYLRRTVLPGIGDQSTLDTVMRFGLADLLTHRLIADFADEHDPEQLIRLVESPGLAERVYRNGEVELVFPAFVRRGMRAEFTRRYPDAARETNRRLSRWYSAQALDRTDPRGTGDGERVRLEQRYPLLAFEHAAAALDWSLVEAVWNAHSAYLSLAHPHVAFRVLNSVPPDFMATKRSMLLGREVTAGAVEADDVHPTSRPRTAALRAYVESATTAAAAHLDELPLHDLLHVGVGRMIGLRLAGNIDEAERFAEPLDAAIEAQIAAGADPGDRRGWFVLQRGVTRTLQHRHYDALRAYRTSWLSRTDDAVHIPANAAANLALTHATVGNSGHARRWLERFAQYDTSGTWGHYLVGIGAHLAAGLLAVDGLDAAASTEHLEHLGDGSSQVELWSFIAALNATHNLYFAENTTAALADLDAARSSHHPKLRQSRTATTLLTRARAELLIAAGQGQRARHELLSNGAVGRARRTERGAGRSRGAHDPHTAVALARISLLSGHPDEARRIIAETLWDPDANRRQRLEGLLISAHAAHRMQDRAAATRFTAQALDIYRETRILAAFAAIPTEERDDLLGLTGHCLDAHELARLRATPSPYPSQLTVIELTQRERLLATALATTPSRQAIADQLYVSVNTVRAQLVTMYRKLDATTRDQALLRLHELGLQPASEQSAG